MLKFTQMYTIPFSAFVGFVSKHGKEMPIAQAWRLFPSEKRHFISYLLKTLNLKNIKNTKIVIQKPIFH